MIDTFVGWLLEVGMWGFTLVGGGEVSSVVPFLEITENIVFLLTVGGENNTR